MKLFIINSDREKVIECADWSICGGVVIIYKYVRNDPLFRGESIAAIKDFSYVGEKPLDELLVKENDTENLSGPPPVTTSDLNVDIERKGKKHD